MDLLKRNLAPITDAAWKEIDSRAKEVLEAHLTARKVVHVNGPKGWDYAAIPEGRLAEVKEAEKLNEVCYGVYKIQPLTEARVSFELNIWEMDNVMRGAKDIDLDSLEKAAKEIALFEEKAIYKGFEKGIITGLIDATGNDKIKFEDDPEKLLSAITKAHSVLIDNGIPAPYSMVVNKEIWQTINSFAKGYPLSKHIQEFLGGGIIYSETVEGALILPTNSEDLELTIGQDFSIGYETHDARNVRLFITESFTFRILDDRAIVHLIKK